MAGKLGAVGLVVIAVIAGRSLRLDAHDRYTEARAYEDVYYLPPPDWLPVLSLGYRDALADLLWVRTLVYFGEELSHNSTVRHVYDYAEAILALDDRFRAVYRWVATASLYRPKDATLEDGKRAVEYLEKAVKLWPDDGDLAWDLGATLRFELVPLLGDDQEARREATLRGSEYIQTAARLGAGPAWLAVTAATGFEKAGRTEQAIRHLKEVYQTTSDPDQRALIEKRLARLESESYVDALRHAVNAFEESRLADYPYMPSGLFLVLGPKPEAEWAEAVARGFRPEAAMVGAESESPNALNLEAGETEAELEDEPSTDDLPPAQPSPTP